jgi:ribosomal subunit interface protein
MKINVSGKQMDVGEALTTHVEDRLTAISEKFFPHAIDAHVVISREGHGYRVDSAIHVGHGIEAQSRAEASEVYACFEESADRVEKQLRRYKRRLRDHHSRRDAEATDAAFQAQNYVIERESEHEAPEDFQPVIVAEHTSDVHAMSVGDAVMKLELGEQPLVVFRNSKNNQYNLVYRRNDGHIGWVDLPEEQTS